MVNEMLEEFNKLKEEGLININEAKKRGVKVVGRYCTYCPNELVLAAGAIPVGLCSTSEAPIPAAEKVLPRNLCPLIKSSYGYGITGKCPFFYFSDLIVGETTCDGKKKMFEIMQEVKPVHVLYLPHNQDKDYALKMWTEEIRCFKKRLESEFNVKITDEAIWEAIELVNEEKKLLKSIHDINKQEPAPLAGTAVLNVSWIGNYVDDKKKTVELLKKFNNTLKEQFENKPDNIEDKKPRIILTGCPVGIGSEKVITIVEELGGQVVALENCSGYKTLELRAEKKGDPIEALAKKYLQIPCSCMSPNPYRIDLLERMVKDFKADAVIDLIWQACHTYNVETYEVSKLVKDKLGLPYLSIETDYSLSDIETLKVRIQAVMEMLE